MTIPLKPAKPTLAEVADRYRRGEPLTPEHIDTVWEYRRQLVKRRNDINIRNYGKRND